MIAAMVLSAVAALSCTHPKKEAVAVHHFQTPVFCGRDIPVAKLTVPDGQDLPQLSYRLEGIPQKALKDAFCKEDTLYIHLDGHLIPDTCNVFFLDVKGRSLEILGDRQHRLAMESQPWDSVAVKSVLKVPAENNSLGLDIALTSNFDTCRDNPHVDLALSLNNGYNYPFVVELDELCHDVDTKICMLGNDTVGIFYDSSQSENTFQTVRLDELYKGPQVTHLAIPVIPGTAVPIAEYILPEGMDYPSLEYRLEGLPQEALLETYIDKGRIYMKIDSSAVAGVSPVFRIDIKGDGVSVKGDPVHRVARRIRFNGDYDVVSYRIPCLEKAKDGTLVTAFDARYKNGKDLPNDIDIVVSRSTDGGITWTPNEMAMDMGEWGGLPDDLNGVGDPCILLDETNGDLLLFGSWRHGGIPGVHSYNDSKGGLEPGETGQMLVSRSTDNGLTWSEPLNITKQIKDPSWLSALQGPGRGITMSDGTLVVPLQYTQSTGFPTAGIIYSRDHGQTWTYPGGHIKNNVNECQVIELGDGSLMLNARDKSISGRRAVYTSQDLGATWSKHPTDSTLIEPFCQASLYRVKAADNCLGRDITLFCNCAHDNRQRRDMTVRMSLDDGMTWPCGILLDHYHGMGYSCMTQVDEDTIGIIYESSQARMTYQTVSIKELYASRR